jgi:hypothetical protein
MLYLNAIFNHSVFDNSSIYQFENERFPALIRAEEALRSCNI